MQLTENPNHPSGFVLMVVQCLSDKYAVTLNNVFDSFFFKHFKPSSFSLHDFESIPVNPIEVGPICIVKLIGDHKLPYSAGFDTMNSKFLNKNTKCIPLFILSKLFLQ